MLVTHVFYVLYDNIISASFIAMGSCWKLWFFFGMGSLVHAAYSAVQHRTYLRLTEQEFTSLPLDIVIQSLVSLIVMMCGILHIAGDFKEIRATMDLQSKSWDMVGNRPSFYMFSHRGQKFRFNS